jgi:hypothetical protein
LPAAVIAAEVVRVADVCRAPAWGANVTLWIVAPNVHVTCPPTPMATLLGVNASLADAFTFCTVGRVPVTVTATLAVRVTDPRVSDTLTVAPPAFHPVTWPALSTSATVVLAGGMLNVGEPGFEMTWFSVSNAVTVMVCELPAESCMVETFVWMDPSVCVGGGGGPGTSLPPSTTKQRRRNSRLAKRQNCVRPSDWE